LKLQKFSDFESQSSIADTAKPKIAKFEVNSAIWAALDHETALFRFNPVTVPQIVHFATRSPSF
jgi:predicted nuclease of restriction endonuclease-like RecB superfamily